MTQGSPHRAQQKDLNVFLRSASSRPNGNQLSCTDLEIRDSVNPNARKLYRVLKDEPFRGVPEWGKLRRHLGGEWGKAGRHLDEDIYTFRIERRSRHAGERNF